MCGLCGFRQKVNWLAAVVPKSETTGFVIAVTFLPARRAHSRRWCESWDRVGGSLCRVPIELQKIHQESLRAKVKKKSAVLQQVCLGSTLHNLRWTS